MKNCDICNASVSLAEGTVYTADEFRHLVEDGYEPPGRMRGFMFAAGMSLEQWKNGLVASSTTPWLLCPSCARGANSILPKAAGSGTSGIDVVVDNAVYEMLRKTLASKPAAAKQVPMVSCRCCGRSKEKDKNCPHCGFVDWGAVAACAIVAAVLAVAAMFWFETTGWIIGFYIGSALLWLIAGGITIANLHALRKQGRGKKAPSPPPEEKEADEPPPAPAAKAEAGGWVRIPPRPPPVVPLKLMTRITIDRPLAAVWAFFTTADNWAKWWGGTLKEVRPGWVEGGQLIWDLGQPSVIQSIQPHKEVVLKARWGVKKWTFQDLKGGVLLEMEEEFIETSPTSEAKWREDWKGILTKLKSCLETIFTCAKCQAKLRIKPESAGKRIKCPKCGHVNTGVQQPAAVVKVSAPPKLAALRARRRQRFDCHSKSYRGTVRLAISPNGDLLASAGGSSGGDICLFNLRTGEQTAALEAHTYYGVTALAISPDSSFLVSAGRNNDGKVRVWKLPQGQPLHTLEGNSFDNEAVAISPDSRVLASGGGGDNGIRLWNLSDGTQRKTLKGHATTITCLAITPDGKTLVSSDDQGVVRMWRLADGEMLVRCRTDHGSGVKSLVVTPDGQIAADGTHTQVRLWSVPDGRLLKSLESGVSWLYAMAVSGDSHYLAATGNGTKSVYLWKLPEGVLVKQLEGHTCMDLNCLAFSPDGSYLASGGKDQDVRLWRTQDGLPLGVLEDHPGHVTCLAISPDNHTVVVGSEDGSVTLWDVTAA